MHVLKSFGMRPEAGVRVTLVTRDVETPYSGMLPGYVAGHYSLEECHIDLGRLARFAGARLIRDEATGLDRAGCAVLCDAHPPIRYDVLSIDIGSTPRSDDVPGAAERTIAVKPIDRFGARWEALLREKDVSRARRYSAKDRFQADDVLEHPVFGIGLVQEVRGDKISVAFKADVKTLVHGKG